MQRSHAQQLFEEGIVVVKEDYFVNTIHTLRAEVEQAIATFPKFIKRQEFIERPKFIKQPEVEVSKENPCMFHNMFSRKMRQIVTYVLIEKLFREFKESYLNEDYRLEVCAERILYKDISINIDKKLKDIQNAVKEKEEDYVFGGWLNLDAESQYVSYVPGSHINTCDTCQSICNQLVEVKPGHIVIFMDDLVHETKKSVTSIRQLNSFRLTTYSEPLHGSDYIIKCIQRQSAMMTANNLYPRQIEQKNESVFGQEIIEAETETFHSLYDLSIKLGRNVCYPDYTYNEIQVFFPRTTHLLLNPYTCSVEQITM